MPWLVTFEDEPSKIHLRGTHTPFHIAYVKSIAPHLTCSGALRESPDSTQTGGMWVIDTETKEEALTLFQGDPFFKEGLRANVRVQHWTKGVWDGKIG